MPKFLTWGDKRSFLRSTRHSCPLWRMIITFKTQHLPYLAQRLPRNLKTGWTKLQQCGSPDSPWVLGGSKNLFFWGAPPPNGAETLIEQVKKSPCGVTQTLNETDYLCPFLSMPAGEDECNNSCHSSSSAILQTPTHESHPGIGEGFQSYDTPLSISLGFRMP